MARDNDTIKKSREDIRTESNKIYDNVCSLLGEYINFVRDKEKGISLRQMYEKTNISIAVLSDIENGKKFPHYRTLIKLANALEIPLEHILGSKLIPISSKETKPSTQNTKPRSHETLRNVLLSLDFDKNEVKDIINFVEFTVSKRNK